MNAYRIVLITILGAYLGSGHAADEGAQRLSEMLNLEYVRLDDTKVSDHGVAALANLPHLRGLSCVN